MNVPVFNHAAYKREFDRKVRLLYAEGFPLKKKTPVSCLTVNQRRIVKNAVFLSNEI